MRHVSAMEKENSILLPEFRRLLEAGHQVQFTPKGVSMRPYIEGGRDSVVLERPKSGISVGDIVLADIGGTYVLHRVVWREGTQLVLHGDGNLYGEEHCACGDVLGVVTMILRGGHHKVRPTRAVVWRHLPMVVRKYVLKIYRKCLRWHPN